MENCSYVYAHLNKFTGLVFYIGIGRNKANNNFDRAYYDRVRNKPWKQYVQENKGFEVKIIVSDISNETACQLEKDLIKKYGRVCDNNGCLVNISGGGQNGLYGIIRTKEHSDKIAKANRGKKSSEETKRKLSLAKKGKKLSEAHVKNMIGKQKGKKQLFCTKYKIRVGHLGKPKGKESEVNKIKRWGVINKNNPNGINSKPIICINNGKEYGSAKQAAKDLNINSNHISSVCSGTRKQTFGYVFKHKNS